MTPAREVASENREQLVFARPEIRTASPKTQVHDASTSLYIFWFYGERSHLWLQLSISPESSIRLCYFPFLPLYVYILGLRLRALHDNSKSAGTPEFTQGRRKKKKLEHSRPCLVHQWNKFTDKIICIFHLAKTSIF